MAIYSISKIQHRRGKKNSGLGLPQLSSAEIAWAVDTQELFIGNGSVEEGAPSVGNTKILTEHDNILDLLSQYQYKVHTPYIQTGITANAPVRRSLQDRLDDFATNLGFDIKPDTANQAAYLQNAINTLFANVASRTSPSSRVVLYFQPGTYYIENPVYIPSYCTIVGAGVDKTVFEFVDNGRFIFVSDDFVYDILDPFYLNEPNGVNAITEGRQARYCIMSGFTISSNITSFTTPLTMNAVSDSVFSNIKVTNTFDGVNLYGTGIFLYKQPTTYDRIKLDSGMGSNNIFMDVTVENFKYAAYSYSRIFDNEFKINAVNCKKGIVFGAELDTITSSYELMSGYGADSLTPIGYIDPVGPYNNLIHLSKFNKIAEQGIYIYKGTKNVVSENTFNIVGTGGVDNSIVLTSQIYFGEYGNFCEDNVFDRTAIASDIVNHYAMDYIPSVDGKVDYHSDEIVTAHLTTGNQLASRLPLHTNASITVEYLLKNVNNDTRKGTLQITVSNDGSSTHTSDEFTTTSDVLSGIQLFTDINTAALQKGVYITAANIESGALAAELSYSYTVFS